MSLQSDPSEWKVGESNPSEFEADAVVEVLKTTDKVETERIGDAEFNGEGAKKRVSVGQAASERASDLAEEEDPNPPAPDEKNDDPDDEDGQNTKPSDAKYNGFTDPTPTTTEDDENSSERVSEDDENYDPSQDPAVGSSVLADIIRVELQSGDSPTLEACKQAYAERKQN
jgi:hypothetical protein